MRTIFSIDWMFKIDFVSDLNNSCFWSKVLPSTSFKVTVTSGFLHLEITGMDISISPFLSRI